MTSVQHVTTQPVWLPVPRVSVLCGQLCAKPPQEPPSPPCQPWRPPIRFSAPPPVSALAFQPAGFCLSPKLPHSQAEPYPPSRPGSDKTLQAPPDPRLAMSFPSAVFLWVWVQALAHRRGPLRQDCPCPAELAGGSQEGGTCDCSWPFSCTHLLECTAGLAEGRTARVRLPLGLCLLPWLGQEPPCILET